jgi:hypothetical protein
MIKHDAQTFITVYCYNCSILLLITNFLLCLYKSNIITACVYRENASINSTIGGLCAPMAGSGMFSMDYPCGTQTRGEPTSQACFQIYPGEVFGNQPSHD